MGVFGLSLASEGEGRRKKEKKRERMICVS